MPKAGAGNLFERRVKLVKWTWLAGRTRLEVANGGWTVMGRMIKQTLKMQCLYWWSWGGCGWSFSKPDIQNKGISWYRRLHIDLLQNEAAGRTKGCRGPNLARGFPTPSLRDRSTFSSFSRTYLPWRTQGGGGSMAVYAFNDDVKIMTFLPLNHHFLGDESVRFGCVCPLGRQLDWHAGNPRRYLGRGQLIFPFFHGQT